MLKSVVDREQRSIAREEFVQNPEHQSREKHSKEKFISQDESSTLAHATEVLRQVEGIRLEKMVGSVEMLGLEVSHHVKN